MNTWWYVIIGFALLTVGAMLLTGIRRRRPRFVPRRGNQPTPTRQAEAVSASPETSTEPHGPRTASERGSERTERERTRG